MKLLEGRRGLIAGVANQRSLASAIARAAHAHGAEVALSYQNERFAKEAGALGGELESALVVPCDAACDDDIAALARTLENHWGRLDFFVHAMAFARRDELMGRFVETSRVGFHTALDASVYSLIGMTRALEPLLARGEGAPSVLTLSYLGGERVVPNYNVMGVAKAALEATVRYLAADLGPRGVRVNALSPGPVRTMSAMGVPGLHEMMALVARTAPLGKNITAAEVGEAAVMMLSELASGMTGEVLLLDGGFSKMAVAPIIAPTEKSS